MIRKLARPMLASAYVADGVETVTNTKEHEEAAQRVLDHLKKVLPAEQYKQIPQDPALLARVAGGTKVAAGSLLAIGKAQRLSAGLLAAVSVPTIMGRHAFWTAKNASEKAKLRNGFITELALLGGLSFAAVDTQGKPGLAWRANKAVSAAMPTKSEKDKANEWFNDKSAQAQEFAGTARERVNDYVDDNKDDWIESANKARDVAADFATKARDKASELVETAQEQSDSEWLDQALANRKEAKKKLVKRANKAQKRADKASAQLSKKVEAGRRRARAERKVSKLQAEANQAIFKARAKAAKRDFGRIAG